MLAKWRVKFNRVATTEYHSDDGRYVVWRDAQIRHGNSFESEWGARLKKAPPGEYIGGYPGYLNAQEAMRACEEHAKDEH